MTDDQPTTRPGAAALQAANDGEAARMLRRKRIRCATLVEDTGGMYDALAANDRAEVDTFRAFLAAAGPPPGQPGYDRQQFADAYREHYPEEYAEAISDYRARRLAADGGEPAVVITETGMAPATDTRTLRDLISALIGRPIPDHEHVDDTVPELAAAVDRITTGAPGPDTRWPWPLEGPEIGHRFHIAVSSSMASSIAGDPDSARDADWWGPDVWSVVVRGQSLHQAIMRASALPLAEWVPTRLLPGHTEEEL